MGLRLQSSSKENCFWHSHDKCYLTDIRNFTIKYRHHYHTPQNDSLFFFQNPLNNFLELTIILRLSVCVYLYGIRIR